mmetsp:Transcript_1230/g.1579  ORF Transcript_1230/g.1579 Transcript_1230/m.1579 type:complete len:113 (-) Transcript_1230:1029-1367(-)
MNLKMALHFPQLGLQHLTHSYGSLLAVVEEERFFVSGTSLCATTRAVGVVALEAADPEAEVFSGAVVCGGFGGGGGVVFFFRSGAFGALGVIFVHVTVPFEGEQFFGVYYTS